MWMAGCQTISNLSKLDRGLHGQYAREFEQSNSMETADRQDLYTLCRSYFEIRHYTKYRKCDDTFRARFAGRGGGGFWGTGSDASFIGPLDAMSALLAFDQGQHAEALRLADRAMSIFPKLDAGFLGDDVVLFRARLVILENAALTYALLGETERARTLTARLATSDSALMEPLVADRRNAATARAYVALGDYRKAREALDRDVSAEKALVSFTKLLPTYYLMVPTMAGTLEIEDLYQTGLFYQQFMTGKVAAATGDRERARKAFDAIVRVKNFSAFSDLYWKTLYERGALSRAEGRLADALADFERAMDVAETMRSSIDETRSRIGFVGNIESLYRDAILTALDSDDHSRAFDYLERSKARALVDMLGARKFGSTAPEPEIRDTVARLRDLEAKPIAVAELATGGKRGVVVQELQMSLRARAPKLAQLVTATTLKPDAVRARLAQEETLVEYYQNGETLVVFVVDRNGVYARRLDGRDLDGLVRRFRSALDRGTGRAADDPADRLYRTLLAPVEDRLGGQVLTVIPHGVLHYLPFAALRRGNTRLIERFFIRILPSASVLQFAEGPTGALVGGMLALGNPDLGQAIMDLPGSEQEVRLLATDRPSTRVLVRRAASESAFKREARGQRIIHVAAHGQFAARDPLNSGLLLAPDSGEDGRLTVDEIYDLRLDADLVTLSACETALGEVLNGDDVVGLARGFLYAGARSVVGSLWRVSDEATIDLMTMFYRHLKSMPPTQALALSQREMIRKSPDPSNWAAFQIMGFGM